MDQYFYAAQKLHRYLTATYWNGQAIIGPDPGIRFNYRIGRFLKSYLPSVSWNDHYYYLQAQGYWTLANWQLYDKTGEEAFREIALRCSDFMLTQQQPDGAWPYPNPEWQGRIATAEGTWGTLGLLESYRRTTNPTFLNGILRWHQFLTEAIGYQSEGDTLAVNYFAHQAKARVPNNSAIVLRFLAELAVVTKDDNYLQPMTGLLNFLSSVQQSHGEFPYEVAGTVPGPPRLHFQCFQYHAFICLDFLRSYELLHDLRILSLLTRTLEFLRAGVSADGHALYQCGNAHRQVTYHAAALAAAFAWAARIVVADVSDLAARTYGYVIRQQEQTGSFPHSRRDYYVLRDRRAYPRYLSMILYHLLLGDSEQTSAATRKERAHETEC